MPPPPSILDLHAKLRSQLALDASSRPADDLAHAFSVATDALAGAGKRFDTSLHLHIFLFSAASINGDLRDQLPNLPLHKLIMLTHINGKVTHAWANLLCLNGDQLSNHTVWSAINNLLSAACTESAYIQQPTPATGGDFSVIVHPPFTPSKRPPIIQDDTPVHANSALQYSTQTQIHAQVNPFLRAEPCETVFKDVQGFYKFFPGITKIQWACAVSCPASCACVHPHSSNTPPATPLPRDPKFSIPPFPGQISEHSVLQWFTFFNNPDCPRTFYTSSRRPLTDSLNSSDRRCDLFLASTSTTSTAGGTADHTWASVLIPVELKASPTKDATSDTIVQLASYAREIFGVQHTVDLSTRLPFVAAF